MLTLERERGREGERERGREGERERGREGERGRGRGREGGREGEREVSLHAPTHTNTQIACTHHPDSETSKETGMDTQIEGLEVGEGAEARLEHVEVWVCAVASPCLVAQAGFV